jgi:hypothetical protein
VTDLFHRALEQPSAERAAFLAAACPDRPELVDEVASLLAAHARAEGFIDRPAAVVAAEDLVGRRVGHYRITRLVGAGGMGVVYEAEDTRLGRTVAVKALAPQYTADAGRRERLRREARAAANLNDPAIATVYALEELDADVYIVSEFVPGETLRDELARGPLAAPRARDTALAIARGLAAAHARGIVHRDLKPENVMRTPQGSIKILDFGLARFRDAEAGPALTGDGAVLGTPAYMSPEQIRHEPLDGRSDLFALGVLLHELLTGQHPYPASNPAAQLARILESDPAPLPDVVPPVLASVVRRCLRKAPADRPGGAAAVIEALQSPAPAEVVSDVAGSDPGPDRRRWWWQFHQVAASAGYLLLLIPLWQARQALPAPWDVLSFVAGLVAATGATVLRLHLSFAGRTYPSELARQRAHSGRWIRAADMLFVAILALVGLTAVPDRTPVGLVLIGSAVVVLIAFAVVEPATTRAALDADEPGLAP